MTEKTQPPVQGDMTGYQVARAISHHFGITISNEDAIKLDRGLRATVFHSMEQARREEREACAKLSQTLPNPYKHCQISSHAYDMAIADYSRAIRARGEA